MGAIDRFDQLSGIESLIRSTLQSGDLPSRIDGVLGGIDRTVLVLIAARSDDPWRCQIWKYLTQYSQVRSPLTGKDLQQLGYGRGPALKGMLEQLRLAAIDGEVCDRESAIAFVRLKFG